MNQFRRALPRILLVVFCFVILFQVGCTTVATITDPQGNVYTYKGPKDVDMRVKKGDTEVDYKGKTPPWWHGWLPVLIGKTPDVTVVK